MGLEGRKCLGWSSPWLTTSFLSSKIKDYSREHRMKDAEIGSKYTCSEPVTAFFSLFASWSSSGPELFLFSFADRFSGEILGGSAICFPSWGFLLVVVTGFWFWGLWKLRLEWSVSEGCYGLKGVFGLAGFGPWINWSLFEGWSTEGPFCYEEKGLGELDPFWSPIVTGVKRIEFLVT